MAFAHLTQQYLEQFDGGAGGPAGAAFTLDPRQGRGIARKAALHCRENVGAGAGALTAKAVDLGIPDEWVQWFTQAVQPDSTILALLVEEVDNEAVAGELARFAGAHLVYANVGADVEARWRSALGDG